MVRKFRIKEADYDAMYDIFDHMDLTLDTLETTVSDLENKSAEELARYIIFFMWCDSEMNATGKNRDVILKMREIIKKYVVIV